MNTKPFLDARIVERTVERVVERIVERTVGSDLVSQITDFFTFKALCQCE